MLNLVDGWYAYNFLFERVEFQNNIFENFKMAMYK